MANEEQEELKVGRKLSEDTFDEERVEKIKKNGIIVLVVLIIFAGGLGYYYYSKGQTEERANKAALAMSKILPTYQQNNFEAAINGSKLPNGQEAMGFAQIANEYEGTREGKLAALYAGTSYLKLGNYNDAITYYNIASESESEIVRSGAYAGIASAEENLGNYAAAAEKFEEAAESVETESIKSKYMYFAGLNYEEAGNIESAKSIYKQVIEIDDKTEYANLSKSSLARLGTNFD